MRSFITVLTVFTAVGLTVALPDDMGSDSIQPMKRSFSGTLKDLQDKVPHGGAVVVTGEGDDFCKTLSVVDSKNKVTKTEDLSFIEKHECKHAMGAKKRDTTSFSARRVPGVFKRACDFIPCGIIDSEGYTYADASKCTEDPACTHCGQHTIAGAVAYICG